MRNVIEMNDGPSPHAWGKRKKNTADGLYCRTIPTRMGKTVLVDQVGTACADHPHTHGENVWGYRRQYSRSGPSPHAWGKHSAMGRTPRLLRTIPTRMGKTPVGHSISNSPRTIPTRMGKTPFNSLILSIVSDHPHTHGEYIRLLFTPKYYYGPSPHAWGKLYQFQSTPLFLRTIPTRMGKTNV